VSKIYGDLTLSFIRYVDFIRDSRNQNPEETLKTDKVPHSRTKTSINKELLLSKIKTEVKVKNLRIHE